MNFSMQESQDKRVFSHIKHTQFTTCQAIEVPESNNY